MTGQARIHRRPAALALVREASAYGLLDLGHAIEHDAKREAVVRGGHRSFHPGGPVGGTMRRSIHSEGYLDGRRLAGPSTDENNRSLPHYAPRAGIAVFVGTNCGYGAYVELGTSKMPARPALRPAALGNMAGAQGVIRRGAEKHLRGRAR